MMASLKDMIKVAFCYFLWIVQSVVAQKFQDEYNDAR